MVLLLMNKSVILLEKNEDYIISPRMKDMHKLW